MAPPKFLAYIVTSCCKMRYPKQNSVIRLKSNILAEKKCYWPLKKIFGLAAPLTVHNARQS